MLRKPQSEGSEGTTWLESVTSRWRKLTDAERARMVDFCIIVASIALVAAAAFTLLNMWPAPTPLLR